MKKNTKESNAQQSSDNLAGHFLIAMPSLNDSFFNQAVTYVCEHDENGSFGVIINQQTNVNLMKIAEEMKFDIDESIDTSKINNPVFIGGPVDQGRGFILHQPAGEWQSSLQINDDMALTTSKDILQAIVNKKGPDKSLIALGYAGWSAGQLESEMINNTWLSCLADEKIIFETPVEERWKAAANLIGVDLSLISSDTGHA